MQRTALLVIFLVICIPHAIAQTKSGRSTKSSSNAPANWSAGLRLGDPIGLSVKKYLAGGKALEFNLGRSAYWGYDYGGHFYNNNKYKDYNYIGYDGRGAICLQAHYIIQQDFPNAKNLQWYWGVGPQLRFDRYTYTYRYDGGSAWVYVTEEVTDLDFGADGLIGLEYHIPNAPLSAFADFNVHLEFFDDPFTLFGQGGIGLRYNFQ